MLNLLPLQLYTPTSDNDDDDVAMCPTHLKRFSGDKYRDQWVKCIEYYTLSHETCSEAKLKKKYL